MYAAGHRCRAQGEDKLETANGAEGLLYAQSTIPYNYKK
jgi:hypothetical protein